MYKLAYEEARRSIDDQRDELNGIRGRAVSFVAFVGSATAFLAGSGLRVTTPNRDALFYVLAGIGSIAALWMLYQLYRLLRPSKALSYEYRMSPTTLIEEWIESDVPPPNIGQFLRALATEYDAMLQQNEKLLEFLRSHYEKLVVGGSAQLIVWAALVWIRS
jgi:hypothetical protein